MTVLPELRIAPGSGADKYRVNSSVWFDDRTVIASAEAVFGMSLAATADIAAASRSIPAHRLRHDIAAIAQTGVWTMPEVHFRVRWPDQTASRCYSPSATIRRALSAGRSFRVEEFVEISRAALEKGSERVRRKHGFACGRAEMQIAIIESFAARYAHQPDAQVTIEAYED